MPQDIPAALPMFSNGPDLAITEADWVREKNSQLDIAQVHHNRGETVKGDAVVAGLAEHQRTFGSITTCRHRSLLTLRLPRLVSTAWS